MKKRVVLSIILTALIGWGIAQNNFQKIEQEDVSQTELRMAISLAEKLLLGQKQGKIYLLSEGEAIPQVAKGLSQEVQVSSYESIQSQFGDFKSLKFAEAWTMDSEQGVYTIYRFKGVFSNTSDKPEIRVVFDEASKLAGFWIRPWEDDLQGRL